MDKDKDQDTGVSTGTGMGASTGVSAGTGTSTGMITHVGMIKSRVRVRARLPTWTRVWLRYFYLLLKKNTYSIHIHMFFYLGDRPPPNLKSLCV